MLLWDTLV
jgi:hypothetical protein